MIYLYFATPEIQANYFFNVVAKTRFFSKLYFMTVNIHVMMKILFVCHYRIWLQLFFHANKGKDFMLGFIAHNPYSLNIYDTKITSI